MVLFSLRVCHCPRTGLNFAPLSTSAMQLLPTAIYYRQIERFQGVSQFVLALDVQAGYLHSFFLVSLHGQAICICERCSYCNQVLRKQSVEGKKKKKIPLVPSKEGRWQWSH